MSKKGADRKMSEPRAASRHDLVVGPFAVLPLQENVMFLNIGIARGETSSYVDVCEALLLKLPAKTGKALKGCTSSRPPPPLLPLA